MRSIYAGTKGGIDGFFKSLACELKPKNIHSMVVHPGYIQTNVSSNALMGDGSKTFGKLDSNIRNGVPVHD
jgi:NAD(P)-dependent dehydrogenase (short-subunit alcohol dehydrogenase family)